MKKIIISLLFTNILLSTSSFAESKIYGGTKVNTKYSFILKLISHDKYNDGRHRCGASLISPFWAITAAHCLDGNSPDSIGIYANTNDGDPKDAIKLNPKKFYIHPGYGTINGVIKWDFALIRLESPIFALRPIKLQQYEFEEDLIKATVLGWGIVKYGPSAYLNQKEFIFSQSESLRLCPESSVICDFNKSGTRKGDSGGPMFAFVNGSYILIGIVSFGKDEDPAYTTSSDKYVSTNGFARVSAAYDWVQETILLNSYD